MTDEAKALVERLRDFNREPPSRDKAADRIEALEAENERLRTGLSLIAHHTSNEAVSFEEYYECCRLIARAALAGDSHD